MLAIFSPLTFERRPENDLSLSLYPFAYLPFARRFTPRFFDPSSRRAVLRNYERERAGTRGTYYSPLRSREKKNGSWGRGKCATTHGSRRPRREVVYVNRSLEIARLSSANTMRGESRAARKEIRSDLGAISADIPTGPQIMIVKQERRARYNRPFGAMVRASSVAFNRVSLKENPRLIHNARETSSRFSPRRRR